MKKELFSIPNLLGYFRILMMPVFLLQYTTADTFQEYVAAFLVLGIALLTDFFDGKIARKFNMITEFGKALDPVADKLIQGTLALAVLSHYPFMRYFMVLFLCKECYMAFMGLYLKKKKNQWNGAKWYGKICTGAIDMGIFVLLLFPELPYQAANLLILVMMGFMVFSLVKYIQFHIELLKGEPFPKKEEVSGF